MTAHVYHSMATKQHTGSCIHPSSVYHRDFFILRLPTFINGQPTEIRGPDTRPVLYSSSLHCSVPLSSVVNELSLVLADHEVGLTHTFCDKHFPLLAVDFSPRMMFDNVSKFLSERSNITRQLSAAIEPLLKASNLGSLAQVEVQLELHLCSPGKEENAETTLSSVTSGNAKFYIDRWERSAMFEFSKLIDHTGPETQRKQGIVNIIAYAHVLLSCQWS